MSECHVFTIPASFADSRSSMTDSNETAKELFLALRGHMKKEQFQKCVEVSGRVLAAVPGDVDAMRVKVSSLVALDKMEDALAVCGEHKELAFERAYCLYRLNKVCDYLSLYLCVCVCVCVCVW